MLFKSPKSPVIQKIPIVILGFSILCFSIRWYFWGIPSEKLLGLLTTLFGTIFLAFSISPSSGIPKDKEMSFIKWNRENMEYGSPASFDWLLFSVGLGFIILGVIFGS